MEWITLADYSAKYKVSVSTLRRRIKAGRLPSEKVAGKYVVPDRPLEESPMEYSAGQQHPPAAAVNQEETFEQTQAAFRPSEDMDFSTAKLLLGEIKRAYMTILQEKEEQIVALKHELADLNTLVRALERENQRLTSLVSDNSSDSEIHI